MPINIFIFDYYHNIADWNRYNQCKTQPHTRVLNLRHVESTFSSFLFTYFHSPGFFLRLCRISVLCCLAQFSPSYFIFVGYPFLLSLSLTQCLSCCAFHLAIFILCHCRQANIVFCQSHFSADIFIPKQKSYSLHHLIPSLTAPH